MSPKNPEKNSKNNEILEIYKMLVDMADRVSARRQITNSFYLSVNTAIIGGTVYLSQSDFAQLRTLTVSIAGIIICCLWRQSMVSYKSLNEAKFKIITELEDHLPVCAYKNEWSILDGNKKKHKPFYKTDTCVPIVFAALHTTQLFSQVPWRAITSIL